MKKKTKIVCTIGPVSSSEEMLEKLLDAGMNVMRLNFSHGNFAEHQERVDNLCAVMDRTGKQCAIMQDLSGPKIRIGDFSAESQDVSVEIVEGSEFTLHTKERIGDASNAYINYPLLTEEIRVGHRIFIHDGKIRIVVEKIEDDRVSGKVVVGGTIRGRRGVNLPDTDLSISALTKKDIADLEFGLKNNVDFVAFSFVRHPRDVDQLREILNARDSEAKIIAKIETPQALAHIDEIIAKVDSIMVARGDLAVEIGPERVPMAQKMMIEKCNALGKPIITATQMLDSMIHSPVPTRAEVSDIANAILDGTDALMLSEETTLGKYPVLAVELMTRTAIEVEAIPEWNRRRDPKSRDGEVGITEAVTTHSVRITNNVGAKAMMVLTRTGFSARMLARLRPNVPIFALTSSKIAANQLLLSFACVPIYIDKWHTIEDAITLVRKLCTDRGLCIAGDKVVVLAGAMNEDRLKDTNLVMVETL